MKLKQFTVITFLTAPAILVTPVFAAGRPAVDVTVANEPANPVPVQVQESYPRVPFQRQQQSMQISGKASVVHDYPVPDGYTLVIESFSVYATVPASQVLFRSSITTTASGEAAEHHFDLPELAVISDSRYYRGLHSVRLYADPGTNVSILIAKQDVATGSLTLFSAISGYLIPEEATRLDP